jgi:4'-phosphopantetheinyl transferase
LHLWLADLDRAQAPRTLLSRAERERAASIVHERRRVLWTRSRAILRLLLGAYLGTDGREVPIVMAAGAKPMIGPPGRPARGGSRRLDLRFNLSHSGERALYALTLGAEVGVDVEYARAGRLDERALAARAWGAAAGDELGALDRSARRRQFLKRWAAHEARIKCVGPDLHLGACEPGGPGARAPSGLWLADLDAGRGAAAAVAMERAPRVVRCYGLDL